MEVQKDKFNLEPDVVYLNMGYMSPNLREVAQTGMEGIQRKDRPYLISPEDFFKDNRTLKSLFSKIIGNPEEERIAIIPSVSYGMANVVQNIPTRTNGHIIVVQDQFPSNYYPWTALANAYNIGINEVTRPQSLFSRTEDWNHEIVSAINDQTLAVAISHTHWSDGTLFDLGLIGKRARHFGSKLIVDGTQSVGALPISVTDMGIDALVCAGYKWLLGPYSIGMAYYGPDFDHGNPIEESWVNRVGSENFSGLVQYQSEYKALANRYNVGESSNFILVPMMIKALNQILEWTPEAIQNYCRTISTVFFTALQDLGFQIEEQSNRGAHLFGIHLDQSRIEIEALKRSLQLRKVYVSFRGNYLRISPYVYNTQSELMQLVTCIEESLKH